MAMAARSRSPKTAVRWTSTLRLGMKDQSCEYCGYIYPTRQIPVWSKLLRWQVLMTPRLAVIRGLAVQDDSEDGSVYVHPVVVVNEAHLPELIQEEAHP
jgi:hypothetical protein